MANPYEASATVGSIKVHRCVVCGCTFAYTMVSVGAGVAPTKYAAQRQARFDAHRASYMDVDVHPCPECGLLQPEMIGRTRARAHLIVVLLALAVAFVFFFARAALVPSYWLYSSPFTVWAFSAMGALIVIAHTAILFCPCNRNPQAQKREASVRLSCGLLRILEPGLPPPHETAASKLPWSRQLRRSLLCMWIAAALMPSSEVVRLAMGWPLNKGCSPPVVGPGDNVTVFPAMEIRSVGSQWRGKANVRLVQADDAGSIVVRATSSDDNWRDSITTGSGTQNAASRLWVQFRIPADSSLRGKTVAFEIKIDVIYPKIVEKTDGLLGSFEHKNESFEQTVMLQLTDPKAGTIYNSLASLGMILGGATIVLLSFRTWWLLNHTARGWLLETIGPAMDVTPKEKPIPFFQNYEEPSPQKDAAEEPDYFRTNHDESEGAK